jgi:hypothetical protein
MFLDHLHSIFKYVHIQLYDCIFCQKIYTIVLKWLNSTQKSNEKHVMLTNKTIKQIT